MQKLLSFFYILQICKLFNLPQSQSSSKLQLQIKGFIDFSPPGAHKIRHVWILLRKSETRHDHDYTSEYCLNQERHSST